MQPDRQLGQPVSALLKIFSITSKTTGSQRDPRRTRLTFPIRKSKRTSPRRREDDAVKAAQEDGAAAAKQDGDERAESQPQRGRCNGPRRPGRGK